MPRYLLELYVPKAWSPERASDDARRVEEAAALDGEPFRYVRTLFVAEDETCFHVFEACSREALVAASRRAGLENPRVTEAVEREPPSDARGE